MIVETNPPVRRGQGTRGEDAVHTWIPLSRALTSLSRAMARVTADSDAQS